MNGAPTRDDIVGLFSELSESLRSRGIRGHVYIVRGAAMILGFRRERTTHDVDARIENDKEGDIQTLLQGLKIQSPEEALEIHRRIFPHTPLREQGRGLLDKLLARQQHCNEQSYPDHS